jgi:hypothetical protein
VTIQRFMPKLPNWNSSEPSRSEHAKGGYYVPYLHPNGDYVFRSRCFSVFDIKYRGRRSFRDPVLQERLRLKRSAWLVTNIGMSRISANILLSRTKAEIIRAEDCVHGVLDSLLLFNSSLFLKGSERRKDLLHLVRKILTIAPYGVGRIMMFWKEVTSFLYNRMAGFKPELPIPGPENFFWKVLSSFDDVKDMVHGKCSKILCEKFAHLTSTRHFASGDRRAEEASKRQFFSSIEEPYHTDPQWLNTLHDLAQRVGEKCNRLPGRMAIHPHISLSGAGSYYATVKDGGRSKETREALGRVLKYCPEDDEVIETPVGTMTCPKGRPRWRYWCRAEPYQYYEDLEFGELITHEEFHGLHLHYQGFDEAIGNQILVVAFLEWEDWKRTGLGIPCRVLTVPEPGYKARIVTTGPFWLNTLQQSVSHTAKAYLGRHPSARSSLLKTDQAWQALYLFQNKTFPEGSACLSSDLKEATDAIPKDVGVQLLSGFLSGCGLRSRHKETCLELLRSHRTFTAPGYVSERQTRGVMMGEPLTKVVLTILNLVVEEYAMRNYLGINSKVSFYESPPWRSYHIGGDDHLAMGPIPYLNMITECHIRSGSKISVGKHGISTIMVKYCEKVLQVSNLYNFSVSSVNASTEGYRNSPFVDSVKVRLLSPLSKAFEVSSERNVAIGKGLSLGRTLKWMNPEHFGTKWLRMVRDRFFQRMGSLLPDRSSGVYWQLMLPTQWGGLNLYLPDEVEQLYVNLPTLTKGIMEDVDAEIPEGFKARKLLRKLLTNFSYRGYRLDETEVAEMTSYLEEAIPLNFPVTTWREIKQMYDPEGRESAKTITDLAWNDGWKGEEDIYDELMRPLLFKELLLGREKPAAYNTERLKTRYAKLWDLVYRGEDSLSLTRFKELVDLRPPAPFYKVAYPEEWHFASDRGYLYKSALDEALHGTPVLRIGPLYM